MSLDNICSSPERAPAYALHRKGLTAADVMANVVKKHGCNGAMYKYCHIQVVPSAGNPNVAIWWWSEKAGKFIQEHTPITKAGVGVAVSYEFTIEPKGRIFFVQLTNTTGGTVDILVSGFQAIEIN